ncbi:hypothetical protein [Amycolatopsis sp. NPDC051371]|uniref:hypothetical protein n=1 Tax=Amycolatopsis sp. NPDC051371 TaxID=3155800 RepID=UPI00343E4316
MDRALVIAFFEAADARFDPSGAAAFARRLRREVDAGRIAFPRPLVIGGSHPHGCLALDRFHAGVTGLAHTARTLTRGLADIAGGGFTICVCGTGRLSVVTLVTRAVACELKAQRRNEAVVGWVGGPDRATVVAAL